MKNWGFVVAGIALLLWGAYQLAIGWGRETAIYGGLFILLGLIAISYTVVTNGKRDKRG